MRHTNNFVTAIVLTLGILLGAATAWAESVRVAMPSKSLTFLNYYLGGQVRPLQKRRTRSEPSGRQSRRSVGGGCDAARWNTLRPPARFFAGAASGLPVKALMFTLDKPIFHMMVRPEIKRIQDLKGKAVAVTAIAATDAVGARAMAKAAGMNAEQDLTIIAAGSTANAFAALQGGAAAAALLSIPFNFKAEELGYRSLGNVADYLRTVLAGLGTSDARIKSNPAQVKRMIRATLRGMDFARDPANPGQSNPFYHGRLSSLTEKPRKRPCARS